MTSQHPGYSTVRIGLRAPRMAIIVPGGDHWLYWARLGMYVASGRWGGAGFVVVPHERGVVHPAVQRAVIAYDPDYVAAFNPTLSELDAVMPGAVRLARDGRELAGAERDDLAARIRDQVIPDEEGERARAELAGLCCSHRRQGDDGTLWEDVRWISTTGGAEREAPLLSEFSEMRGGPQLQAPAAWGGDVGALVAARCGLVDPPDVGEEPHLEASQLAGLQRWLVSSGVGGGRPPEEMVWSPGARLSVLPEQLPSAFDATLRGLTWVAAGAAPRQPVTVVVGDAASDFALALILDRLYGRGIWLPDRWADRHDTRRSATQLALEAEVDRAYRRGEHLDVVSTSLPPGRVDEVAQQLRVERIQIVGEEPATRRQRADAVRTETLRLPAGGRRHLAVDGHFAEYLTLPVDADSDGGVSLVGRPPVPRLRHPDLASASGLTCHVDVEFSPGTMPRGRGLDGYALLAPGEDQYLTWIRSGRDGVSFPAARYDFVAAGTPSELQVARPRVRDLGLLAWARTLVQQRGFDLSPSAAGRRAAVLERLFGSRAALADAWAGPQGMALRAFVPNTSRTEDVYKLGHGVVLDGRGYLTFEGFRSAMGRDVEEVRAGVDDLCAKRVLRRGLVLDCSDCGRVDFVPVDDLRQVNACRHCAAPNQMRQQRWRQPAAEPVWHYDIHGAARDLVREHGDIPLLLSQHLRRDSRQYSDVGELELIDRSDGSPQVEIDLIAVADGQVVVAEAKTTHTLGGSSPERPAAEKRLRSAETLSADVLILATTKDVWAPRTWDALRHVVDFPEYPLAALPEVRLITSLGEVEPGSATLFE